MPTTLASIPNFVHQELAVSFTYSQLGEWQHVDCDWISLLQAYEFTPTSSTVAIATVRSSNQQLFEVLTEAIKQAKMKEDEDWNRGGAYPGGRQVMELQDRHLVCSYLGKPKKNPTGNR
jgi:hypothetical protein